MNINILRKHNDNPTAKKVLFVPIHTWMFDYYEAFINNDFELYSLNFGDAKNKWDGKKYISSLIPAMDQVFLKACEDIKPDWVFLKMDKSWLSPQIIKEAKALLPNTVFTNWTGDVRKEPKPGIVELGKVVDITLIVSTGQIDLYKKYGLDCVEYLQTGVKPCFFPLSEDERERLRKELKHDIVFCANNAGAHPGAPLRKEVASKLHDVFGKRFAVYGGGWNKHKNSCRKRIAYDDQQKVYNGCPMLWSIRGR